MTLELAELPRYMVIEPGAGVRLDIRLTSPACEIDAEIEAPRPGKSFILMIGHKGGPFVQRARISGGARLLFDPESPGEYVLMLVNPMDHTVTVRLQGHGLGRARAHTRKVKQSATRRSRGHRRAVAARARSPRPFRAPVSPKARAVPEGTADD
jgi:hypothetical protein